MFSSKMYRILQVFIVVFACSYLNFSQIGGGGGSITGSLTGQLGGILDKIVFAKVVKQNSANSNKSGAGKASKNTGSKPQNSVAKNKTVKRSATKNTVPNNDYENTDFGVINYQPNINTKFDQTFADMITQKPDEKVALLLIFAETKKSFNAEAKKLKRENDLALVFTFFISACLTVYHDAPEPTDEATENLYQVIAKSLSESSEISNLSNQDKNLIADKLLYISGLVYVGYLSGKQSQDAVTMRVYQQTAGICLESLIGISAESIEFDKNGLKIRS